MSYKRVAASGVRERKSRNTLREKRVGKVSTKQDLYVREVQEIKKTSTMPKSLI